MIDFSIVPNAFDNRLTKLKLTFHGDGGDESETLELKPENTLQDFPLKPHALQVDHAGAAGVDRGRQTAADRDRQYLDSRQALRGVQEERRAAAEHRAPW